ncbi:Alpha/Beta hydrolase protein [Dipodascopsis tothii]|uniref:Alpha/Beta hydrolase protein n=1 Tax=Dipodascopsis tothii TaxID=44089 RepID=UPI0034CEFA1D
MMLRGLTAYRGAAAGWAGWAAGTRPAETAIRPAWGAARAFSASAATRKTEPVELVFQKLEVPKGTERSGQPPILILHGLFGSKQNNRTVGKIFARDLGRDVYVMDLRNHGHSPHAPQHDYPALALDVEHFIDTHGLGPSVVIGHSMGAKTAMAVALRRPELVSQLVSVDNAPIDAALSSDFPKYVRALKSIERAGVPRIKDAYAMLAKFEPDINIQHFLLTNAEIKPSGKVGFRVPVDTIGKSLDHVADFPFHPDEARYEGPTLFIRGTRSHYVPDEAIPVIGRFFPRFVLKDVEAGHWLISENPGRFVELVEDFLGDQD